MMAETDGPSCTFSHCFCRWHRKWWSSPPTPRVAHGRDYVFMPADADDSPAWSLLVGVVSKFDAGSSLRLHRFRVARSGRVLGRSGDALEVLAENVDCKPTNTWPRIRAAAATLSPDGRSLSLCLFSRELDLTDFRRAEAPRPVELHLDLGAGADDDARVTVSPLPRLSLGPLMPTFPITAADDLWAPYLTELHGPSRLVMQRFDRDAGRWVEVADLHLPHGRRGADRSGKNAVFQGFAVVGSTILLSLYPSNLFFTFDCSTLAWAAVITDDKAQKSRLSLYVPIQRRSVYLEEDDTIYSLCGDCVYGYKLCRDQGRQQHWMAPPTMVDRVCPFLRREGTGFLTHLGGRIMCYVWIGEKLDCNCDTKHVLITTFRVIGDDSKRREFPNCFVPRGIDVLHSTCRRLKLWPSKQNGPCSFFEFSILQEYEEFHHENATASAENTRQEGATGPRDILSSSNVVESSKMLACCRKFIGTPFSHAVRLEPSPIQMNKTLYVVCQVASSAVVFEINILDGKLTCHDQTLAPRCAMNLETFIYDDDEDRPLPSHYACASKFIYVVSKKGDDICECSLDTMTLQHFPTRPIGDICLICKVGNNILAITDCLQCVYSMSSEHGWMCHKASGIPGLERKVNLSGYVVLSDETFMVSDADSSRCFLFDLRDNKWKIVMPYALKSRTEQLQSSWPGMALLSGRSIFAKGFIYTCSSGGLAAYELIEEGDTYYIGDMIDLQFTWHKYWEHERMCLDCVGEDLNSGAIMFCVVQDDDYVCLPGFLENHSPICFTIVQVKTEGMLNDKLKPKAIGHVDIGRSFIKWKACSSEWDQKVIWARACFAADGF